MIGFSIIKTLIQFFKHLNTVELPRLRMLKPIFLALFLKYGNFFFGLIPPTLLWALRLSRGIFHIHIKVFYFNKHMKHRLKIFSRTHNGLGVLKLYNHVCLLNYLLLIEVIKIISKNSKLTFHYIYVFKFTFKFQSYEVPQWKELFSHNKSC